MIFIEPSINFQQMTSIVTSDGFQVILFIIASPTNFSGNE